MNVEDERLVREARERERREVDEKVKAGMGHPLQPRSGPGASKRIWTLCPSGWPPWSRTASKSPAGLPWR